MVNEFRYGHQSASVDFNRPEREDGPQLSFNTFTTPILTAFGQGRNSPVNEFTDNLTKVHGNHTFKFGGQLRFTDQYGFNDAGIYPNISLSTANGNLPAASVSPAGLSADAAHHVPGPVQRSAWPHLVGHRDVLQQPEHVPSAGHAARAQLHLSRIRLLRAGRLAHHAAVSRLNLGLRWEFYPGALRTRTDSREF